MVKRMWNLLTLVEACEESLEAAECAGRYVPVGLVSILNDSTSNYDGGYSLNAPIQFVSVCGQQTLHQAH